MNTSRVNRNTPMCDVYSEDHVQKFELERLDEKTLGMISQDFKEKDPT